MTTPLQEIPALKMHLFSVHPDVVNALRPAEKRPKECRVSHRTFVLTAANPYQNIAQADPLRKELHIEPIGNTVVLSGSISQASDVYNGAASVISTPPAAISQPAVPASTVAVQNTNAFPVQVVLSTFTLTQVFVNGIQVGTTNGTYTVPAYGAISITYTVVGTWVWTNASANTITSQQNPNGRILNPFVGEYVIPGENEMWLTAAIYPTSVGVTFVREI